MEGLKNTAGTSSWRSDSRSLLSHRSGCSTPSYGYFGCSFRDSLAGFPSGAWFNAVGRCRLSGCWTAAFHAGCKTLTDSVESRFTTLIPVLNPYGHSFRYPGSLAHLFAGQLRWAFRKRCPDDIGPDEPAGFYARCFSEEKLTSSGSSSKNWWLSDWQPNAWPFNHPGFQALLFRVCPLALAFQANLLSLAW